MTHRRVARIGWGLLAGLVGAIALYLAGGHAFITSASEQGTRTILRNLVSGAGPFTTRDYLQAADDLAGTVFTVWLVVAGALAAWPWADGAAGRAYRRVRSFGESELTTRPVVVWLGAGLILVVLIGIGRGVLQDFSNSGDEYCYRYQAETLARGRVANTAHAEQDFFDVYHVRVVDGRVFSVFPPGWPAVLAIALVTGVPLWIVNPLLGLCMLGLTWAIGRRLYGQPTAAVAVVALAVSPFFLFTSASYFAHALCAVLVLTVVWFGLRAMDEPRAWSAIAAGAAIGAAMLTRNYTAVCCAVPFGLALMRRGRLGWTSLAWVALGWAPFFCATLAYNQATMGDPLTNGLAGMDAYDQHWFPVGWFGRALEVTAGHVVRFVQWTPPILVVLLPAAWRAARRTSALRFTDAIFPALIVGYFFYVNRGGNQYGPRFYYEALPFAVLTVTAFVLRETRYEMKTPGQRLAWYAYLLSVAACIPLTLSYAQIERQVVEERSEPYRLVATRQIDHAVVFIASGAGWTRPMSARDLTRNNPDRSDRVLYVHDRGSDNARLMRAYPDRSYYRYRFDPVTRSGSLDPLPPPERVPAAISSSRGPT